MSFRNIIILIFLTTLLTCIETVSFLKISSIYPFAAVIMITICLTQRRNRENIFSRTLIRFSPCISIYLHIIFSSTQHNILWVFTISNIAVPFIIICFPYFFSIWIKNSYTIISHIGCYINCYCLIFWNAKNIIIKIVVFWNLSYIFFIPWNLFRSFKIIIIPIKRYTWSCKRSIANIFSSRFIISSPIISINLHIIGSFFQIQIIRIAAISYGWSPLIFTCIPNFFSIWIKKFYAIVLHIWCHIKFYAANLW